MCSCGVLSHVEASTSKNYPSASQLEVWETSLKDINPDMGKSIMKYVWSFIILNVLTILYLWFKQKAFKMLKGSVSKRLESGSYQKTGERAVKR